MLADWQREGGLEDRAGDKGIGGESVGPFSFLLVLVGRNERNGSVGTTCLVSHCLYSSALTSDLCF